MALQLTKKNRIPLFSILVIMLAAAFSSRAGWFDMLEAHTYDSLFLLRGAVVTPEEVVVVAIDEPSFGVIGKQWPWPRHLHAQLIEGLFQKGAETVAADIVFADRSEPSEDRSLADVIKRHPNLIIAAGIDQIDRQHFTQQIQVMPIREFIQHPESVGINIFPVDKDGFVRQTCLNYDPFFSFANVAVASYQHKKPIPTDNTDINNPAINHQKKININYYGSPGSIKTVSYYQALHPEQYLPKNFFKGKLVFIGFSLQNLPLVTEKQPDYYFVPYSRHIGKTMAGVEIHATIAANLLQNSSIRPLPFQSVLSIMILFWGILILSTLWTRLAVQCMIFLSLIGMTLGSGFILFAFFDTHLPLVLIIVPMIAGFISNMGFQYFQMFKERRFIRQAFSAYISPELVKALLKSPENLKLGGEFVDATVLQLDIRGFTSLAENLPAQEVVQILNTYLGAFAQVIFKWNGMIDKFIGDGIMAVWGVPVAQANHADLACNAAMEMLEKVAELNSKQTAYPEIHIRIGINSGRMLAGNVGAEKFFNYTVHGDDVNLAVRLEGANKEYATRILIGSNTLNRLQETFIVREIDQVQLRGKQIPVMLYELMGTPLTVHHDQMVLKALFDEGRRYYIEQKWDQAFLCFEKALLIDPNDWVSHIYLERCKR